MRIALTREVSPHIGCSELTHIQRTSIDVELASSQHRLYEECLTELGCAIRRVTSAPELPDSVFVEDTALVVDELAVMARPGAESRRAEVAAVAEVLKRYREVHHIRPPGTLDGGDVLVVGRRVYVGRSLRTNRQGIEQLEKLLEPKGYRITSVPVSRCLHLKSAVTRVEEGTVLINRAWVDSAPFGDMDLIEVDPAEPFGANALLISGRVVYPAGFPATRARLEKAGIRTRAVDVSELAKAEGGVTCCSLVFARGERTGPDS